MTKFMIKNRTDAWKTDINLHIERFHVTSRAFDRYLKMRLCHIGVARESYIVKKDTEIFTVSSLLLRLKFVLAR